MANLYIIIYIDNSNVVFMYDKVANRDFPTYYYGFYTLRSEEHTSELQSRI